MLLPCHRLVDRAAIIYSAKHHVAGIAHGYDANGNLSSDGSTSYAYDAENRLISASGAKTATLAYDPLGRLWRTGGGSLGASSLLYDGDRLVVEYDADSGGIRRRFMHGPGIDEPILWDEGAALDCSGAKFVHTDHQGSIVALARPRRRLHLGADRTVLKPPPPEPRITRL